MSSVTRTKCADFADHHNGLGRFMESTANAIASNETAVGQPAAATKRSQ